MPSFHWVGKSEIVFARCHREFRANSRAWLDLMCKRVVDLGMTKQATADLKMTASQILTLRAEFATVGERISFEHADRLIALMDRVHPETMQQLADADIRFVSAIAKGRILRKGAK